MTYLSKDQRIALAIIPKFSSVFSLFGSMWIIVEVATEKTKRQVPYHRLLLAMSVYDVLESIWNFFSTWPIPEGSPHVIWAYGNTASCNAQGFFLTLSSAVPLYNAMLSLYYVLVIKYNYTDRRLRSFVEPAMHTFCFLWAFVTAVYSVAAGLINNADLWCWIAPLPADCLESWVHGVDNANPCVRGDNIWIYRFGFYFIPLWISIAVGTYCTYVVYKYVYVQDKATLRYRRPERKMSMWNKVKSVRMGTKQRFSPRTPVETAAESMGKDKQGEESHSSTNEDKIDETAGEAEDKTSPIKKNNRTSSMGLDSVPEDSEGNFPAKDRSSIEELKKERPISLVDNTPHNLSDSMKDFSQGHEPTGAWAVSMRSNQSIATVDSADVDAIQDELARRAIKAEKEASQRREKRQASEAEADTDTDNSPRPGIWQRYQEWKARREQYARDMPHTVEVFHQALFYLGAFYCTHIWSTTNRIVQSFNNGHSVFFLLVMHAFFDPFQGFLNYMVYQRPRFIQMKKKYPDMSFFQICRIILRFTYMGEYKVPNN